MAAKSKKKEILSKISEERTPVPMFRFANTNTSDQKEQEKSLHLIEPKAKAVSEKNVDKEIDQKEDLVDLPIEIEEDDEQFSLGNLLCNLQLKPAEESVISSFRRKKYTSKYYYKIENHFEVFKLATSFLDDFDNNIKRFAFTSPNNGYEVQKTVLGLASFFNYHKDTKVTIVVDDFTNSFCKKIIDQFDTVVIDHKGFLIETIVSGGIEIIQYSELFKIKMELSSEEYDYYIKEFLEKYKVILFELPGLQRIKESNDFFFPIIQTIHSISLLTKKKESMMDQIKETVDFYQKYNVNFKGFIVAE